VLLGATSFARDHAGPARRAPRRRARRATASRSASRTARFDGARRPVYAGKAILTVGFKATPALASLRPNVFSASEGRPARRRAVESDRAAGRAREGARRNRRASTAAAGKLELTEAEVVVSGGRGLKTPENFAKLIEPLAARARRSRRRVARGGRRRLAPARRAGRPDRQDGRPEALHRVRHLRARSSTSPACAPRARSSPSTRTSEAPIFKVADYGIVGDVDEVLPRADRAGEGAARRALTARRHSSATRSSAKTTCWRKSFAE
jgi:electron transfer flavoprotein alpha subunit